MRLDAGIGIASTTEDHKWACCGCRLGGKSPPTPPKRPVFSHPTFRVCPVPTLQHEPVICGTSNLRINEYMPALQVLGERGHVVRTRGQARIPPRRPWRCVVVLTVGRRISWRAAFRRSASVLRALRPDRPCRRLCLRLFRLTPAPPCPSEVEVQARAPPKTYDARREARTRNIHIVRDQRSMLTGPIATGAHAVSGHIAALPSATMNARRLMGRPLLC